MSKRRRILAKREKRDKKLSGLDKKTKSKRKKSSKA